MVTITDTRAGVATRAGFGIPWPSAGPLRGAGVFHGRTYQPARKRPRDVETAVWTAYGITMPVGVLGRKDKNTRNPETTLNGAAIGVSGSHPPREPV